MNPRLRRSPSPRWPFWLLMAAWFCANTPQAASFAVLTWLDDARHFSHQQRLAAEVASILAGEKTPDLLAKLVADAPEHLPPSPVPADAVLKKLDLAVESATGVLPPALRAAHAVVAELPCPDARRVPPPHEPPRAGLVA